MPTQSTDYQLQDLSPYQNTAPYQQIYPDIQPYQTDPAPVHSHPRLRVYHPTTQSQAMCDNHYSKATDL